MDERLAILKIQLYSAAQILKGDDLKEFWEMIDEFLSIREMI